MVEGKLYKRKLCLLYQKGRCTRQTCSFAHGGAELRRSFGSYNGGREYRFSDLRDKLDRRRSPQQRFPPGRDARGQRTFHGHSPSRSLEKKSDRKRSKKQQADGQSEFSGSLKISEGTGDRVKDGNITTSGSKLILQEQLKGLQLNIDMLDHHKQKLEMCVEEKVQEADILSSRIKELETQLHKEREECKRIASKIKKFVKAHNHHSQMQDELKRSQAGLQKLGDQLVSDVTGADGNEEDSSINIVSDGETTNYHLVSPQNDRQTVSSPKKKRLHVDWDIVDGSMQEADLKNYGGQGPESILLEKDSRWNLHQTQSNVIKEVEPVNNGNNNHSPLADEGKLKRRKTISTGFSSADKGFSSGHVLPSTSMATHAVDEEVDAEIEEIDMVEMASVGIEKGKIYDATGMPFRLPPLPPIPRNAYLQSAGDDEIVDVVG